MRTPSRRYFPDAGPFVVELGQGTLHEVVLHGNNSIDLYDGLDLPSAVHIETVKSLGRHKFDNKHFVSGLLVVSNKKGPFEIIWGRD